MGLEAQCQVHYRGTKHEGKALLETGELIFRGKPLRLKIPFGAITEISAEDGVLQVRWREEEAQFTLGSSADKWLYKITNPRTLVDKLGVRTGMRVSVVDLADDSLRAMLETRDVELHEGSGTKGSDIIFLGADSKADLSKLSAIRAFLKPNGAIWLVRPKGTKEITDSDVRSAAKQAGLVDVKVAGYSERLTAEKLVIPVSKR